MDEMVHMPGSTARGGGAHTKKRSTCGRKSLDLKHAVSSMHARECARGDAVWSAIPHTHVITSCCVRSRLFPTVPAEGLYALLPVLGTQTGSVETHNIPRPLTSCTP